ncbi:MAG: HicA protein [Deltaproteobacteria bacterium]|nr:MAG: HicA protein [Deltaproteobacteria bacterium]
MNNKQRKILKKILQEPADGNLDWAKIESLFLALGCRVIEGKGSGVTFEKYGIKARFHRPHPGQNALRYRVIAARDFLQKIGVTP